MKEKDVIIANLEADVKVLQSWIMVLEKYIIDNGLNVPT